MELKVVCQCGQKYKFDVEPASGRMPFTVNCPVCNADGTATANAMLAEMFVSQPAPAAPPPPTPAPVGGGLRISRSSHAETAPAAAATPTPAIGSVLPLDNRRAAAAAAAEEPEKKPSFGMGLLGGLIGAVVGSTIYLLIFKYSGYQIKLLAIGVGALAGWLGEYLGKGEGSKELGGLIAVFVLSGIIGAQYFVALGWWHEVQAEDLKEAQAIYSKTVDEAKKVATAIPTGSDVEICKYLAKATSEDGERVNLTEITPEDIKEFRETLLPEYRDLANGNITKEQFEKQNEIKTSLTKEEQQEEDNTFKGVFLLLLLSKVNLVSLAAAAGLAFKLSANA